MSPLALVGDYYPPSSSSASSPLPVLAVHLAVPLSTELPSQQLRALPCQPSPGVLASGGGHASSTPGVLLRTAPQRSLWAQCAFSASASAQAAAAAALAVERQLARQAALAAARRTEGGLAVLLAPQLERGLAVLEQMGPAPSLTVVEHKVNTLWGFVRLQGLFPEGPAGEAQREQARCLLVAHFSVYADVFRHFCVGASPAEAESSKAAAMALLALEAANRPLNGGAGGGSQLGMGMAEWTALCEALGLCPSPLPKGAVEGLFRAANSDRQRDRGLGGDDMDERSLAFYEALEALGNLAENAYAGTRDEDTGKTLGSLEALGAVLSARLTPLAAALGAEKARAALHTRPVLTLLSGALEALQEGVYAYYSVPASAARERRRVAAEWGVRRGQLERGEGGGEEEGSASGSRAAAVQPLVYQPGLFINPSRAPHPKPEGVTLADPPWLASKLSAMGAGAGGGGQQQGGAAGRAGQ